MDPDKHSVLRLVMATVASGGGTYLLTDALEQSMATSLTLSVLIGGVTVIVRFLITFEKRLAGVERQRSADSRNLIEAVETTGRKMERRTVKSNRAASLLEGVEGSGVDADQMRDMVRYASQVAPGQPDVVLRLVESTLRATTDFLQAVASRQVARCDGEDRNWLLALTDNAVESIDAISLAAADHGFWETEIGSRYLASEHERIQTGVRVRRIFVVRDRAEWDSNPAIGRVYAQQRVLGIEVRLLERSAIQSHLRRMIFDGIIFDNAIIYQTQFFGDVDPSGRTPVDETRLDLQAKWVRTRSAEFEKLWDVSGDHVSEPARVVRTRLVRTRRLRTERARSWRYVPGPLSSPALGSHRESDQGPAAVEAAVPGAEPYGLNGR